MRPTYKPPRQRGRGRAATNSRENNILAQIGNQRLIAANVTEGNTEHPLYKEFMDFIKSKKDEGTSSSNVPTYSSVISEDANDNFETYSQKESKELIILLEQSDLKWKDNPWQIMARYFDTASYATPAYKYRMHYEIILSTTGSADIQHFYPANTRKTYSFSKIIIKKVIPSDEWGISTLKDREYTHPDQKISVKFNYWDYVESFNKTFLYENPTRKHSWFIKLCPNLFGQQIPNWFFKWWKLYGPSLDILNPLFKGLYSQWVDISPKIISLQKDHIFYDGIATMYFFIEFSIPWIMKWNVQTGYTSEGIPCLNRIFYHKFWSKLLQSNQQGKLYGEELIQQIQAKIEAYSQIDHTKDEEEDLSPLEIISKRLQMKKGAVSQKEILASYFEEIKKDLAKNLGTTIGDDISMVSIGSTSNEDVCLAGEAQNQSDTEEVSDTEIEDFINKLKASAEASSAKKNDKGKDKA